jgi:hypothetical protein
MIWSLAMPSPTYAELGVQAAGLPGWTLLPVSDWHVGNNMRVICYADDEIEAYARALEIDP